MAFSTDLNFGDWVIEIGKSGNSLFDQIQEGEILYQKFINGYYGKSNEDIIALPGFIGRTVDDIIKIRYALGAMHDLWLALYSGVVSQRDRVSDLIPFL